MNNSKVNLIQIRLYLLLGSWLCVFTISHAETAPVDAETVKTRIVAELLAGEVDDAEIEKLLNSQREDGRWPGINYEDVSRTGFEHRIHSGNMVNMGQAYNSQSSDFYKSKKLDRIHFRITAELDKSGEGFTSKWDEYKGESEISIDLPKTVYAGKSVILEF
jgi:hypothetical protein